MTDRISIINRALLRIGSHPLQSEDVPGAQQAIAIYDSTLNLFAADPWSWMQTTTRLVRMSAPPNQGFLYAYQLAPERVGPPRRVFPTQDLRESTTAFDIEGDLLLTDCTEVWVQWMLKRPPGYWPGDFTAVFEQALMAEFALSIREDRTLHATLYQKAFGSPTEGGKGGMYGAALDNDSQGTPSEMLGGGGNPLIDVRF